jgi:hypothetical protein
MGNPQAQRAGLLDGSGPVLEERASALQVSTLPPPQPGDLVIKSARTSQEGL